MDKELVWLDKKIVAKMDVLQDVIRLRGEEIEKVITKLTDETKLLTTDNIDTTLLEMKLHAQKVRDTYKQTVDEELDKTNTLWEECDEKIYQSRTKISLVTNSFIDLNREVEKLKSSLNNLPIYQIEEIMKLLDKFNSYSDKDKELLRILLKSE